MEQRLPSKAALSLRHPQAFVYTAFLQHSTREGQFSPELKRVPLHGRWTEISRNAPNAAAQALGLWKGDWEARLARGSFASSKASLSGRPFDVCWPTHRLFQTAWIVKRQGLE